jgi:predicted  nucleic acid-binding Zn-ribbon protein
LASKEHKELKKERKAISEFSETIKSMKNSSKAKESESSPIKPYLAQPEASSASVSRTVNSKEEEIERLKDQRNGLLNSGAYSQYDMVIKEMERRIVQLANSAGDGNKK